MKLTSPWLTPTYSTCTRRNILSWDDPLMTEKGSDLSWWLCHDGLDQVFDVDGFFKIRLIGESATRRDMPTQTSAIVRTGRDQRFNAIYTDQLNDANYCGGTYYAFSEWLKKFGCTYMRVSIEGMYWHD